MRRSAGAAWPRGCSRRRWTTRVLRAPPCWKRIRSTNPDRAIPTSCGSAPGGCTTARDSRKWRAGSRRVRSCVGPCVRGGQRIRSGGESMRRLQKSSTNRMLFGVAGGIAEYFRIDPVIVRVVFILLTFANGIGVLIYLVLALILPRADSADREPMAVVKDNVQSAGREATEAGRRVVATLRGPAQPGGTE